MKMFSHAIYNPEMLKIFPHNGPDLFDSIQSTPRRYVFDTNMPIVEMADAHPNDAFILGPTLDKESNFWRVRELRTGRANIFVYGVGRWRGERSIQIDVLDPEILETVKKRWSEVAWAENANARAQVVNKVLSYKFLDQSLLAAEVILNAKRCVRNFHLSVDIAEKAFALALFNVYENPSVQLKAKEDLRRMEQNDKNILGDAQLLQAALFFQANILSKDGLVGSMAWFCDIDCSHVPRRKPPNSFST